ncbi:MAG: type II toxin-antitoxin system antitoxin SocA domain-containing protein [Planctomycetota bacterium]
MSIISAKLAAEYLLAQIDDDSGDTVSNLKLQKLLYYAQGVHLALHGVKLFHEKIKAWEHGPVVPQVWHEYKDYGTGVIPPPSEVDFNQIDEERRESLDETWDVFGQFSAWKLRNMTHAEPPWKNTSKNEEITPRAIKSYFKTMIEDEEEDG